MGKLVVAVAGGLVGSLFGMPELGFLAGSLLGAFIFPSSNRGGPKLTDLNVTASTYGQAIIQGWGTARIGGNVIWSKPLNQHKHSSGGKGGPSTYTYSWTGGIGLCATDQTGPIDMILRIWADTKLVYDATGQSGFSSSVPTDGGGKGGGGSHNNTSNGTFAPSASNKLGNFTLYTGTQTQLPDPAEEDFFGAANCPAYRGMARVVMDDVDLENYGERVPNWTFEVAFNQHAANQLSHGYGFDDTTVGEPDNGAMAIDPIRHNGYFFALGDSTTTSPAAGIHTIDLETSTETGFTDFTDIFGNTGASHGLVSDTKCVDQNGYLYTRLSVSNWAPLFKIDPDSMKVVGQCGTNYGGFGDGQNVTFPHYMVPVQNANANFLVLAGLFNKLFLINTDSMVQVSETDVVENTFVMTPGEQLSSTYSTMYAIGYTGTSSDPLSLYRIDVGGGIGLGLSLVKIGSIEPNQIASDWNHISAIGAVLFDSTDGGVIFSVLNSQDSPTSRNYVVKFSGSSALPIWRTPTSGIPDGNGANQSHITSGTYAFVDTPNHAVVTIVTSTGQATSTPWTNISASWQAWDDSIGSILMWGTLGGTSSGDYRVFTNSWGVIVVDKAAANADDLANVVTDICENAGMLASDIDVTLLAGTPVEGYIVTNQMAAKSAIEPLSKAFLFDAVESDNVLKFVPRGGSSVGTIAADDLAIVDTKTGSRTTETRVQEMDLPAQVSLTFFDPLHDYQTGTAYSRRASNPYQSMYSRNVLTEQLPLVAEPTFMQQTAEKILYSGWIERTSYTTKLPWTYVLFDPTDIVTIDLTDGTTVLTRTLSTTLGADLSIEANSAAEAAAAYTSTATTDGGLGFVSQSLIPQAKSKLFLLDIPLLRDIDDTGFVNTPLYYSAGGYKDSWGGAEFFKSNDNSTFNDVGGVTSSDSTTWGSCVTVLGDTDLPFAPDYINSVEVNIIEGAANLSDVTLEQACNGANMAAILNPLTGVAELINFMTVTMNLNGTYTLSNLLRGRRGTEVYTGTHTAGENFVLLSTSSVASTTFALSDMNVARFFKIVTFKTAFEQANSIMFTDTGRTWKPYAPVHATATASGADIVIGWTRRTRVGGELMDGTGTVPLSEQDESYQIDIYDPTGMTVLRTLIQDYGSTIPVSSPSVTYTATQMNEDFGAVPSTIIMTIYQMGNTGRGFGKQVAVTVVGVPITTERFWGASALTSLTAAQILALPNHDLNVTFDLSTSYVCTGGLFPYFCYPTSYGTPTHVIVNGLPFSDFSVSVVSVTIAGVATNYNVLKFNNLQHGASIPVTWA